MGIQLLSAIGIATVAVGGILLATQLPFEAVIYRIKGTSEMTVDESEPAMERYTRKLRLYRLGIFALVVGSALQAYAS